MPGIGGFDVCSESGMGLNWSRVEGSAIRQTSPIRHLTKSGGEGNSAWSRFIHCDLLQIDRQVHRSLVDRQMFVAGHRTHRGTGGSRLSRLSRFSRPSRALIRIRMHATAHTPDVAAEGFTVAFHEANAEVHEPRVGGILGTRRRRPITGRLDVVKGMA